jgi:hypothetical protein
MTNVGVVLALTVGLAQSRRRTHRVVHETALQLSITSEGPVPK